MQTEPLSLAEQFAARCAEIERETMSDHSEEDSAFYIGLRDGYGEAVQWLDWMTGGDGEYCFSTIPERSCPTPVEMAARIVDRTRTPITDDVVERLLVDAAKNLLARMSSTYRARNGRQVGIEGDDGEKCWIVHSDEITQLEAALSAAISAFAVPEGMRDVGRLKFLADNSYDLRCFDMPTGGGDADIGWRVIGHWQAEPCERTIAEVFHDDPRAAIDAAMLSAAPKGGE